MKNWNNIDDILDYAIDNEIEAYNFYLSLAEKSSSSSIKKLFKAFAGEEDGHRIKLEAAKSGTMIPFSKADITNLKVTDYLVDIEESENMSYQDALILAAKKEKSAAKIVPMTLEGCVVRFADTVSYIGRDIEDAIILGLIKRTDIPAECSKILGDSNGSIVYNLVTDLIRHSRISTPGSTAPPDKDYIGFSDKVSHALQKLKAFNYEAIYMAPDTQKFMPLIKECYQALFSHYLDHLVKGTTDELSVDLMSDMGEAYTKKQTPQKRVRDFIAGMTDDYFLKQAQAVGCEIPAKQ